MNLRADVSSILSDPEFADKITLIKQINEHIGKGRFRNFKDMKTVGAVVMQVDGIKSQLYDNGKIVHGAIEVYSRVKFTAGNGKLDSDIIEYDGAKYFVKGVRNWGRYGRGFTVAFCELIPIGGEGDQC